MRDEKPDFTPDKILKVYKSGSTGYYIEIHPVYRRKGEYAIGAGQPLTKKTLQKLIGVSVSTDEKAIWWENPIISSCILSFCVDKYKRHIIWYRPKTVYNMLFTDEMHIKSGPISMPALLFFTNLDKIKMFALKSNKRPDLRTKLYHAPLFNAVEGNQICWGNVSNEVHNIMEVDKEINTWENYLWNSKFSHDGTRVTKHSLRDVYRKMGQNKPFPLRELVDTGLTIDDLIDEL